MSIELIIVILFLTGIGIMAYFMRGAMLHKLQYLPGEQNIFDEGGLRLRVEWVGKPVIYPGSRIIVTNKERIIVAQKPLIGNSYHLKYVIYLSSFSGKKEPWKGYINFYTRKQNISFPGDEENITVKILVQEAENIFMKKDAVLLFNVKDTAKLKSALNRNITNESNI